MCGNGSVICLIGVVILATGVVLHVVGVATPEWSLFADDTITVGLWQICVLDCVEITTETINDNMRAARAFAIIGLASGVGSGALALLNILFILIKKSPVKILSLFSLILGIIAFGSICVCAGIWGSGLNTTDDGDSAGVLGYSFIVSVAGGVVIPTGALVGFLGTWFITH